MRGGICILIFYGRQSFTEHNCRIALLAAETFNVRIYRTPGWKGLIYNLADSDLRSADLSRASLMGADLYGALLQGALLENASLRNSKPPLAIMDGSILGGADFTDALTRGGRLGALARMRSTR